VRAERLCDLDRERANAAACTVNEDSLPGLDTGFIAEALERRDPRHPHGSGLLERGAGRHRHEAPLGDRDVLGERADRHPEDRVARPEPRHVLSDRLDDARDIRPESRILRASPAIGGPDEVRPGRHPMPVDGVDGRGADPHQDLVRCR